MKSARQLAMLILFAAVICPAAAEPLRLEVTYSSPSPETALECFGFGGAAAPSPVVARFHFDSASLPTDDVNQVVVLQSLTAAGLDFGDASWALPELQSFVLGVSQDGTVIYSLEYEFAQIDTTTTSDAVASDSGFQLQVAGSSASTPCTVLYTVATAVIVPDEDTPPVEKTYVHHAIAPLGLAVRQLAGNGVLRTGEVKDLRNRLGLAYRDLSVGDMDKALNQLALYETSADQLNENGRLSTDDYAALTSGLSSLTLQVADLGDAVYAVESAEFPTCRVPPSCANRLLNVDGSVFVPPGLMDGSAQYPFSTITGALEYAADLDWTCVDVQLKPGRYAEGVIPITRDTRIAAVNGANIASALQNLEDHFLSVDGVTFTDSGVGAAAAVEVRAAAACTVVQNAVFSEIRGNAIAQEGGALTVRDARVTGTRSRAQESGSGRAVRLTGGVDACFSDVVLNANRDGALLADGPGTRVYATRVEANENRTVVVDQLTTGAIVARNGALLLSEVADLLNNELQGIGTLTGAGAHFRHTIVSGTRLPAGIENAPVSNAGAYDDARLQLSSFTLAHSATTGITILSAHAALADGFVRNHRIGAAVIPGAGFPMHCLQHNVAWIDNVVNLDTDEIDVPQPENDLVSLSQPLPGDDDSLPADCVLVPFNPSWCAAD